MPDTVGNVWLWIGFTLFILALLAIDLGVFNRKSHVISPKEAMRWVALWVTLALLFCAWVFWQFGRQRGMEFLVGYMIEYALSVDNIFVFLVIFSYFRVPAQYQHRVLFWGVVGAIVLRASFILAGAGLIKHFHFVIYLFGVFLILTGIKLLVQRDEHVDPERNPLVRLFRRFVPLVTEYHGSRFWVTKDGVRHATPLLLVLIAVEGTDVLFAVDSIPAIFGVTRDPFIVYTSNIFAILGLRSLYFLLAGMMDRFRYLKVGLSIVLTFIGVKMLLSETAYRIPIEVSLAVVVLVLGGSVLMSLWIPPSERAEVAPLAATAEEPTSPSGGR